MAQSPRKSASLTCRFNRALEAQEGKPEVKYHTMLFVALIAAASVTVSANLPVGTLTGEPTEETTTQRVSSLNAGMDGMVEANAIVQMASSYNSSPVKYNSANDEVQVVKTKELYINGKKVLVRPDGTLATKYTTHRPTRRIVRRVSNGSSLALKKAITKANTAIKSVDRRLKNVEAGFDAVVKTVEKNQETAEKALAATKTVGKTSNNLAKWAIGLAILAGVITIIAFFRRNREIGVSSYEFEEFVTENDADHMAFENRIKALEDVVGTAVPLTEPEAATDEEIKKALAEESEADDKTTKTT